MESNGVGRITGIRQIVRLRGFIQKWQSNTISSTESVPTISSTESIPNHEPEATPVGISPAINKRLQKAKATCDSDEDGCNSPEPPHDVPKGYLAVYVGSELRRFIIPTSYLSHQLFNVLLKKAEEEFGFDHSGGLTIPCDIETFKYLLTCMENNQKDPTHNVKDNDFAEGS